MILITGATGTVGKEVIKETLATGAEMRAMVRRIDRGKELLGPDVNLVQGDLEKPDTLDSAMQGVDHLFLLSPSGPNQVQMEKSAVEAAKRNGVEHIIKLSVLGASPFSPISIERWHWICEKYIEESEIGFTFIRPTTFMQNTFVFAPSIISENRFYAPMHNGRVSMIDVRDIAAVAAVALTQPGHLDKTYELTGPEAVSYHEIAERISESIERTVTFIPVPPESIRQGMIEMNDAKWLVDDMIEYYKYFENGMGEMVLHNVSRIAGKEPVTFTEFAKDYAGVFRGGTA